MKTQKNVQHIFFCDYTQTYRSYPENYWLASVKENQLIFDSWEGMLKTLNFKDKLIKLYANIQELKNSKKRLTKCENLTPVIVQTENCNSLGIQFWTDWQIKNKEYQTNTDKTKSYFVSKL